VICRVSERPDVLDRVLEAFAAQRAMATAMIYPKAEKGGRGKKATDAVGFSSQRLSYARTVLAHSPPESLNRADGLCAVWYTSGMASPSRSDRRPFKKCVRCGRAMLPLSPILDPRSGKQGRTFKCECGEPTIMD
jgi:hypothetical protein